MESNNPAESVFLDAAAADASLQKVKRALDDPETRAKAAKRMLTALLDYVEHARFDHLAVKKMAVSVKGPTLKVSIELPYQDFLESTETKEVD